MAFPSLSRALARFGLLGGLLGALLAFSAAPARATDDLESLLTHAEETLAARDLTTKAKLEALRASLGAIRDFCEEKTCDGSQLSFRAREAADDVSDYLARELARQRFEETENETRRAEMKTAWESLLSILQDTRRALINPGTPAEEKSLHIDSAFQSFEDLCVNHCGLLLKFIGQVNREARGLRTEEFSQAASFYSKSLGQGVKSLDPDLLRKILSGAEWISELDVRKPELLRDKIRSSVELLRFIVSIEEESILKALSAGTRDDGVKSLVESARFYQGQITALLRVGKIVKEQFDNRGTTGRMSQAEIQAFVGDINRLGLFYVKLAQTFSNLSYLFDFDPAIEEPLKAFQDQMPPIPPEEVVRIITRELGKSPYELFDGFDPAQPIASGTIATTFKAKPKGKSYFIILKVRREGLDAEMTWNRKLNRLAMKAISLFAPVSYAPILDILFSQVIGLENAIEQEPHFRIEGRNARRFRALFRFVPGVRIPKIYARYSTDAVLGMEYLEGGINLDRTLDLKAGGRLSDWFDDNRRNGDIQSFADLTPFQVGVLAPYDYDQLFGDRTENEIREVLESRYSRKEEERSESDRRLLKVAHELDEHGHHDSDLIDLHRLGPAPVWRAGLDARAKEIGEYETYFRKILKTFLYMLFLGKVHADLHPGNVLGLPSDGEPKLGLVDWAQVTQTRGLLLRPFLLAYSLVMGDSRGTARNMVALGSPDVEIDVDRLAKIVDETFRKHEVPKKTMQGLIREAARAHQEARAEKKGGGSVGDATEDRWEQVGDRFRRYPALSSEILRRAYEELGYRVSPGYVQAGRAVLPTTGILLGLMVKLTPFRALVAAGKEVALALPAGIFHSTGALFPRAISTLTYAIESRWHACARKLTNR